MISSTNLLLLIFVVTQFKTSSFAFEKAGSWRDVKEGRYSKKINELYDKWLIPSSNLNVTENANELRLIGIRTPDDSTYVGVLAKTAINAKLSDVQKVLKDIQGYQKIYSDLDEVTFTKNSEDECDIHWKFSGPMGTHTVYNTVQKVLPVEPKKAVLVYQLKKSDDVLESDGFILLQESNGLVKYLSVDFFNAKWGVAGAFFKNKIWSSTFDSTKKATLAIKAESEKLSQSNEKATEAVKVEYTDLEDRAKQKTFDTLVPDFFEMKKN